MSQNGKLIAFYARKLNPAQWSHTTTEQELLAIVETLKEFRTTLLGQQIKVHADQKNLTFANFNTERVLRWRMVLEEHDPELNNIQGEHDLVADMLSRLDLLPERETPAVNDLLAFNEDDVPSDCFPVQFKRITQHQHQDK